MAGTRISVIPKTFFTFTNVQAGQPTPAIVVAKSLDCRSYREITLMVRVHSYTISQPIGGIAVFAVPYDPTIQDPTSNFTPNPPTWIYVGLTNTQAQPSLLSLALPQAQRGPYMQVLVGGQQAATAGTIDA